jgi:hypothetical protein
MLMDQPTTPEQRVLYEGIVRVFQYSLEVTALCATYSAHSGRDKMCSVDARLANCFFCPVFAHALETRDPSYAGDTLETVIERAQAPGPLPATGYRASPEAFVASTCGCTICAGMNAADPVFQPRTRFETLLWAVAQRMAEQPDQDLTEADLVEMAEGAASTAPPTEQLAAMMAAPTPGQQAMMKELDALVAIVVRHLSDDAQV